MSLLTEIQSKYSSFSAKDKGIADYLLSSPAEASRSTIQTLAKKTNVSNATITRFCKKVSCKNFSELKVKLASETHHNLEDNIDSRLKQQYVDVFRDVQGLNRADIIHNTLQLITKANRIYIYGLGSSGLAAQELNYRLNRMGFTCEAVTDSHLMIIRSTLLKEDDLLIAFSRSGQTKDLITSIIKARKSGAKIVSLTAYENTHLTKLSDEVLKTIHPGRNAYLSTGLDLSTLFLIDLISMHFLKDPETMKIYENTIAAISSEAHLKQD